MSEDTLGRHDRSDHPSNPDGPPRELDSPAPPVDLADLDVPCRNCSFNLRGLSPESNCPECGTPIWRSIRGNLLIYAGADYLSSLSRGLNCILIAALLQLAVLVTGIAVTVVAIASMAAIGLTPPANLNVIIAAATLPITMLTLYGWWLFSAPDPGVHEGDRGDRPRRTVRGATIVLAAASLLSLLAQSFALLSPELQLVAGGVSVIASVAGIVQFFASILYVRWLAPRFPSPSTEKQASQYLWLLPLIYILGMCVIVGPFVATIMYFLFLNRVRLLLRDLRLQQPEQMRGVEAEVRGVVQGE